MSPVTKYRSDVTIIVRPSVRDRLFPLTAYVAGKIGAEGQGNTVWEAIEDLFTCGETAKVCRELEREVAEVGHTYEPSAPEPDGAGETRQEP